MASDKGKHDLRLLTVKWERATGWPDKPAKHFLVYLGFVVWRLTSSFLAEQKYTALQIYSLYFARDIWPVYDQRFVRLLPDCGLGSRLAGLDKTQN